MPLLNQEYLIHLEQKMREWESRYEEKKEKEMDFESDSGISIKRFYTPLDIDGHDYLAHQGFPGEMPFTPLSLIARLSLPNL